MHQRFLFLLVLLLLRFATIAQTGTFFIQNYNKHHYKGESKAWSIAQAPNKIIYMGQSGLFEYDGVKWANTIEKIFVRDISFDEENNIYIAASDDFGMVQKDEKGKKFTSFLPLLPDSIKKVTFVINVVCKADYVYFSGENELYIYQRSSNKIIEVLKSDENFARPTLLNNVVYLVSDKNGLTKVEGKKITPLPNLTSLAESGIMAICSRGADELIILSYNKGISVYHLKNQTLSQLQTPINDWIIKNRAYAATQFADKQGRQYYVIGTNKDGIYIIDQTGKPIQHLNKTVGLPDNNINALLTDHNNNIWAATDKGVSQLFTSLPFTEFGIAQNIQSTIYDVLKHEGRLYLGTSTGVMVAKGNQFEFLAQMPATQSWDLQPFGKDVIVAGGNYGFYYLVDGKIRQNIEADWATMAIGRSAKDSNVVFNAKYQGFEVLRFRQGKFEKLGHIKEFEKTINRSVFEDTNGAVWVGVPKEGFYQIKFEGSINENSVKNAKVTLHTKGLGEVVGCYVVQDANKQLLFSTRSGLYVFDEQSQSFALHNPYQIDYKQRRYKSFYPSFDSQNNAWLPKTLTILRKQNQQYAIDSTTLQPLLEPVLSFFEDKDSVYWLATGEKLYQYDAKYKIPTQSSFPAVVRMVKISSVDSILCQSNCLMNEKEKTILPYQYNSLLFEYATLSYYSEKDNQFQYKLEGYENSWSVWTKEARKEYTNLPEGNYRFVVRAKNALQEMSTESSYTFVVKPPFYRTWWAYLAYALAAVLGVYSLVKLNTHRLIEAKIRLEKIVQQRTQEVQLKNVELEQQKEEILAQSENLKQINEEIKTINEELNSTLDLANFQKREIEKQHEDITASITYAQRIQTAMLPFEERISKSLHDFFVFYQPRDIVSGDFYWFQDTSIGSYSIQETTQIAQDNKVIMVVADCTGHGVPGAFMSMIGNELLNQIVNMHHITSPDKILEALHKGILYALKQEQSNNKDGMDIAIMVLTKHQEENKDLSDTFEASYKLALSDTSKVSDKWSLLEYAGAMNPLYLVTAKNSEILPDYLKQNPTLSTENADFFDIKATKHPIGGHSEDSKSRVFEKHSFDLTKKAADETLCFYLCSDGYQDQFGGEKESKFMVRKFKKLLFDIHEQPLAEQKQVLEQTFMDWKGKQKQIDDVLVMGVRL